MANELGRKVIHRYLYARSWALGDRKSPLASTPCMIKLNGDCDLSEQLAPFSAITDNEIPHETQEKLQRALVLLG